MKKKRKKKNRKIKILIAITIILGIMVIIQLRKDNFSEIATKIVDTNKVNGKSRKKVEEITENSSFPEDVKGVKVTTKLIESGTQARPGTKRKIKYIVIHETDNFIEGTGARNHAEFLSTNNTSSTSWHYTVDDKEIYHHIPDNEIAHHAADELGNKHGIGVELCVNRDGKFEKTFTNAAKLVAYLMKEYNLTIDNVKTHHDFSGKDCPHSILKNNRFNEFKRKVKQFL